MIFVWTAQVGASVGTTQWLVLRRYMSQASCRLPLALRRRERGRSPGPFWHLAGQTLQKREQIVFFLIG